MDGIKESERAAAVCGAEGRGFDSGCAASWVSGTMFLFFFFFVVFVVFVVFERRWEVGRYGEEMGKEGQKWIDR